jgi:NAD(P)-dependent dehydrogenase (short-subunit alcohol dehydrogenase family)
MNLELANKSIVVTSGSSNIGRTIVLVFAQEGVNITTGDLGRARSPT